MRVLKSFSRFAAIGVLVIGGIWGFLLSLDLVSEAAGSWAVVAAVILAPFTVVTVPFYAGFAWGEWMPLALNYGGGLTAALLLYFGAVLESE